MIADVHTALAHLDDQAGIRELVLLYADPARAQLPATDASALTQAATTERLLASTLLQAEWRAETSDDVSTSLYTHARDALETHIHTDDLITNTSHYLLNFRPLDHIGGPTASDHSVIDYVVAEESWSKYSTSKTALPSHLTLETIHSMRHAWNAHIGYTAKSHPDLQDTLASYARSDAPEARAAAQALFVFPDTAVAQELAHDLLTAPLTSFAHRGRLPVDDLVASMLWDDLSSYAGDRHDITRDHLARAIGHDSEGNITATALDHAHLYMDAEACDDLIHRALNKQDGYYPLRARDALWNQSRSGATPRLLHNETYACALQKERPYHFYERIARVLPDLPEAMRDATAAQVARLPHSSSHADLWAITNGADPHPTCSLDAQDLCSATNHHFFNDRPQACIDYFGSDAIITIAAHADLPENIRDNFLRALWETD